MARFVLDASVAIAGFSPDEKQNASAELVEISMIDPVAVPALWFYEISNVLAMKVRRKTLTVAEHKTILQDLANILTESDSDNLLRDCTAASELALRFGLSVYDAAYLELAIRLQLPLATLDAKLADAARTSGVDVLPDAL